jgi:hypothetical protein
LDSEPKVAGGNLSFNAFERSRHASLHGLAITTLQVPLPVQDLLVSRGATLRDYVENQSIEQETILIGELTNDQAPFWQNLYARVARGANAVFLSSKVFAANGDQNYWLPLNPKGRQIAEASGGEAELYHSDYISKPHLITTGLPTGIMAPPVFGALLATPARFVATAAPDETVVVSLRNTWGKSEDGFTVGIFNHHHGKLIINSFNLIGGVGRPATDRLIVNLLRYAGQTAAADLMSLPNEYANELTRLGIRPDGPDPENRARR